VECEGTGPDAVLDGLRAGRVAISAQREGPVLLRMDDELIAVGADGTILADPQGPRARVTGDKAVFPAAPGFHRLTDITGGILALTP
jgi:hypothetical protein